jgi:uncharacterized Zn finger protein (UPF0148 family)
MAPITLHADCGADLLAEHCTDCSAPLAETGLADVCFDAAGNVFCCPDCMAQAFAAAWEDGAYPQFMEHDSQFLD